MSIAGPLFITTDAVGGVWSYSLALARGVAATGARCVLAVIGPAAQPEQRSAVAEIAGCRLLETRLPLDWTVTTREELGATTLALIRHARDAGCSAAHVHAPALAGEPWPMPVVAVAHSCMATWWDGVHGGAPPASIAWHKAATSDGLCMADAIVAPSESFAAALRRIYRPINSVHVVHNGLPEPPARSSERDTAVLAAGRLWDPAKNIAVLDAAAAMMGVPVRAAGPGRAPDGSRARFSHLRELGTLSQHALQALMARTAIFAAPSLYEPFGLAVLEAAQQSAALILSDIPIFRELWSGAAVFVQADRPAAWAASIAALADDPERTTELGHAAVMRSRRYTQHAMVEATLDLHRRVGHGARRAA